MVSRFHTPIEMLMIFTSLYPDTVKKEKKHSKRLQSKQRFSKQPLSWLMLSKFVIPSTTIEPAHYALCECALFIFCFNVGTHPMTVWLLTESLLYISTTAGSIAAAKLYMFAVKSDLLSGSTMGHKTSLGYN